jgi:hypothetical protein
MGRRGGHAGRPSVHAQEVFDGETAARGAGGDRQCRSSPSLQRAPGCARGRVRFVSSSQTVWRRRRRLEVAGELAGVEACGGNVRPHGEHGNQEPKQG